MPPTADLSELEALCLELEPHLLRRPGGNESKSPGRSSLERSVRAALPFAGVELTGEQAINARRGNTNSSSLPKMLKAIADAIGETPTDLARRLLAVPFELPDGSPVTPRPRPPSPPVLTTPRGVTTTPRQRASPPTLTTSRGAATTPHPCMAPPTLTTPRASTTTPRTCAPASTLTTPGGTPTTPRTRTAMLAVSKFDSAWASGRVQSAYNKFRATWGKEFARLAPGKVWNDETLDRAAKRAGVVDGPVPSLLRARAVAAAGNSRLDRMGALRALTFVAVHQKDGAAKLSPRELPAAVESALRGALAALMVGDSDKQSMSGVDRVSLASSVSPSVPSGPVTPATPPPVVGAPKLTLPVVVAGVDDDAEDAADEAINRAVKLPLDRSIGEVLRSSTERDRRARERTGMTPPFAQERDVETSPFSKEENGPGAVAALRKEVYALRRQLGGGQLSVTPSGRRWGFVPLAAAAVGSIGVGLIVLVAAEMLGVLGDPVPFVQHDFRAFI